MINVKTKLHMTAQHGKTIYQCSSKISPKYDPKEMYIRTIAETMKCVR